MVLTPDAAEALALRALTYLAEHPDKLVGFLSLSGQTPADLRGMAEDPGRLGGVMDYILSDDATVLEFAEYAGIAPTAIGLARGALPGAMPRDG